MATESELHISSGSKLVRNLCLRLRTQTARVRCEGVNVSLRSVCLRFTSCLALAVSLNHSHLFQLLSALPKKDRTLNPLMPTPLPSPLPLWVLGIRLLLLASFAPLKMKCIFFSWDQYYYRSTLHSYQNKVCNKVLQWQYSWFLIRSQNAV